MSNDERDRWQHILESADQVAAYVDAVGYDEFCRDVMRQDACAYRTMIIGEAAARLASRSPVSAQPPELRFAADMRNFLIHEYWKTDVDVLWQAITVDIPRFAADIRRHLDG